MVVGTCAEVSARREAAAGSVRALRMYGAVTWAPPCLTTLEANNLVPILAKLLADCRVTPMFRAPPFGTRSSFGLSGCEPRKRASFIYVVGSQHNITRHRR